MTKNGWVNIESIEDNIELWTGKEFLNHKIEKGTDKVYKIVTDYEYEIECTKSTRIIIKTAQKSSSEQSEGRLLQNIDLERENRLIKASFPEIIQESIDFLYPYTHGFFCADGCEVTSIRKEVKVYNSKKKLVDDGRLIFRNMWEATEKEERGYSDPLYYVIILFNNISPKFMVPINGSIQQKLEWLAGYLDGDGCCKKTKEGKVTGITASSINKEFLKDIRLMLQTIGINCSIYKTRDAKRRCNQRTNSQ